MKKACKYCGKIHDRGYVCEKKPPEKIFYRKKKYYKKSYYKKRDSQADLFRSSYDWKQKREYVKKRDRYLCQACLHGLKGTVKRLNTEDLSVHHIIPISADYSRRLDESNLITLCNYHHELAESGEIQADTLFDIIPPIL